MMYLLPLVGGFISRIVGGGFPAKYLPIPAQWLFAVPYFFIFDDIRYCLFAFIVAGITKRLGHGQYIGLSFVPRPPKKNDEKLDIFVKPFFGEDNGGNYWRCVWGLAVTGLVMTLPIGIAYAIQENALIGLIFGVSGALKALAYMIGWELFNEKKTKFEPTVIGEFLTGVFSYGFVVLLYKVMGV